MPLARETAMDDAEIDAFLGDAETGVPSLADGRDPYAIPIFSGYDADPRAIFLRLVSTPDSSKGQFLGSSPRARLVVYDDREGSDVYLSVVATGRLAAIEAAELTVADVEQFGETRRPLFEIWGRAKPELDVTLHRLEPEEISGRRTVVDREG